MRIKVQIPPEYYVSTRQFLFYNLYAANLMKPKGTEFLVFHFRIVLMFADVHLEFRQLVYTLLRSQSTFHFSFIVESNCEIMLILM